MTVKVYCALVVNAAPTFRACDIVTAQVGLTPEHAPDQPAKVQPPELLAVSVTMALAGNALLQAVPQLIPAGTLLTEPLPLTTTLSPKVEGGAVVNTALTVVVALTLTAHVVLAPEHAPDQPEKIAFAPGVAVSVTDVPWAKAWLQAVPQVMPAGELVTVPVPWTLTTSVGVSTEVTHGPKVML